MDANSPTMGQQSGGGSLGHHQSPSGANSLVGNIPSPATFSSAAFLYATQLASSFASVGGGNSTSPVGANLPAFSTARPSSSVFQGNSRGESYLSSSHNV